MMDQGQNSFFQNFEVWSQPLVADRQEEDPLWEATCQQQYMDPLENSHC